MKDFYHENGEEDTRKPLDMMDTIITLIVVKVPGVYTYIQIHQIVFIRYVQFFGISVVPQ